MRIGIDLGGTKIEGVLLHEDGAVMHKLRVATPAESYTNTVSELCSVVDQLQACTDHRCSVGIGTPGALSKPGLVMKNSNSVALNGMPLQKDIEQRLGYPVRLENDANCFALSEAHFGAAKSAHTVFGVILGTGTGGGIVIDRQLHTGPNSIAGEWGHNPVPASVIELIGSPRTCYCGRQNCIETVLSGRGLAMTFQERFDSLLTAAQIAELANGKDETALACLAIYSQQLARCLATVVNILDPDVIVLGGGLSNIQQLYIQVEEFMRPYVFTDELQTRLLPPTFGDASGALGAACLWPHED